MRDTYPRVGRRSYTLLPPSRRRAAVVFGRCDFDSARHQDLLGRMQRLRGAIYLGDGAIAASELTVDGRHALTTDVDSWHLLLMEDESVVGCMRYRPFRGQVPREDSAVYRSALARCAEWGQRLATVVRTEEDRAFNEGIGIGEAGGWALAHQVRRSSEALRMVLATYSLAQLLGDALVFSTATSRNGSASILRRIGGTSLAVDGVEIPAYFDPKHDCEMELLRFDSRSPNAIYLNRVAELRDQLENSVVVCATPSWPTAGQLKTAAFSRIEQYCSAQ